MKHLGHVGTCLKDQISTKGDVQIWPKTFLKQDPLHATPGIGEQQMRGAGNTTDATVQVKRSISLKMRKC